jgi:hypothetical protein
MAVSQDRPSRREGLHLEAVDPRTGKSTRVQIAHHRMHTVGMRSLGHAKECAFLVPMILQHPTAIFEGLRRDEDEDPRGVGWLCYCGSPTVAYDREGVPRPPYAGQVFLVFVNDERVAYNWRWEKADPEDPRLPIDYGVRFKRKVL